MIPRRQLLLFLWAVIALGALPTVRAGDDRFAGLPIPNANAPFLPLDGAWPARLGTPENAALAGIVIEIPHPTMRPEGRRLGPFPPKLDDSDPLGAAALRARLGLDPALVIRRESDGAFICRVEPIPEGQQVAARDRNRAAHSLQFASLRKGPDGEALVERTWFFLFEPTGEHTVPRGLAVQMPGIFGTPEGTINLLTTRLRREGWYVLRMFAQSSRFTERVEFTINPDDLEGSAAAISRHICDRAAECAFAVQGGAAEAERLYPPLRDLPRIAVGFSGGAMTLPTVVAREADRYAAAIMVGGGADYWLLVSHSNYADWIDAASVKWTGGPPTPEQEAQLNDLYLNASPLDSFHTAGALRGKPMLMVQGNIDMAVPAPLGDVLWERLGRPDRWTYDVGHELLFMQLPGQYDRMMEWLRGAVPAQPAPK